MKRSCYIISIVCASIMLICQHSYTKDTYEIDKPIYQDDQFVFLQIEDSLLIFKKWNPLWYVFPFKENITTIKHIKKSLFLINDDEVVFSGLKSLLFYKKSKQAIHGKVIRNFDINASFNIVKKDHWTIQVINSAYTVEYYWRSENVKYIFKFVVE